MSCPTRRATDSLPGMRMLLPRARARQRRGCAAEITYSSVRGGGGGDGGGQVLFAVFSYYTRPFKADSKGGIPYKTSVEEGMKNTTMLGFSPISKQGVQKINNFLQTSCMVRPKLMGQDSPSHSGLELPTFCVSLFILPSWNRGDGRTRSSERFDLLKGQRCCQIPGRE